VARRSESTPRSLERREGMLAQSEHDRNPLSFQPAFALFSAPTTASPYLTSFGPEYRLARVAWKRPAAECCKTNGRISAIAWRMLDYLYGSRKNARHCSSKLYSPAHGGRNGVSSRCRAGSYCFLQGALCQSCRD
jgi:hypothetical protein